MEEKLAAMLKEKRGQFMESNDIVPFTKILMKMTKMAQVLKHIHTVFQQVDLDGNGTLELDELQTLLPLLLHAKLPAAVDSACVAGLLDLLRTEGLWIASTRFGYVHGALATQVGALIQHGDRPEIVTSPWQSP